MKSRHAAWLLCALGVAQSLSTSRPCRAEDDATIEMARQRFREGVQFYDQHLFEKARLAFLQAYALKPHPSVLLNLAQSELRSGHPDDAATHFSQYLRVNTGATDAERQETTAGYNTAKSRVGEVLLTVEPAGAQVVADGVDKGAAPLPDPLYLLPGTHTIEVRANDRHASKSLTLAPGQSVSVQLLAHGSIAAAGTPSGEGAPAEEPPEAAAAATPEPSEQTAPESPPPSESVEPKAPAEPESEGAQSLPNWFVHTPTAWVLTGIGVVGLALGGTMAIVSSYDYSSANKVKGVILDNWDTLHGTPLKRDSDVLVSSVPCRLPDNAGAQIGVGRVGDYNDACSRYSSDAKAGDLARNIAIAGTAVGGAALLGTVIYYFLDRRPANVESKSAFRAHAIPWTASTGAGVAVFGTF